ncbi:hypothetical protein BDZ97DRAFT_780453 [Flammula alnicola]|nr:hypothetical protein BDZ97DRAFT_780453 [Flammula alnicola]
MAVNSSVIMKNTFDTFNSLELQLIATSLSAVAYGIVAMLFVACSQLLWKRKHSLYSKRVQICLLLYGAVMFALSTVAFIQELSFTRSIVFHTFQDIIEESILPTSDPASFIWTLGGPASLPFAIWGAQAFLVWHCAALYQGSSRISRTGIIFILALVSVESLVSGILFFMPRLLSSFSLESSTVVIAVATHVNISLALLIILRLLYQQKDDYANAEGGPVFPYTRIVFLSIESFPEIIMVAILYLALFFGGGSEGYLIPLSLLPHICAFSPSSMCTLDPK